MDIRALIIALMIALGLGPTITTVDAPAAGLDHAVRLSQFPPVVLAPGEITDTTGLALPLLQQLYTPTELAAGGDVLIRNADTGIYSAWVLWNGLCGAAAPICIEIKASDWSAATPERNRSVMAHEWAHVLTNRYQQQIAGAQATRFNQPLNLVNQECMADSLAAIVLERDGFPPSTGRYSCPQFWIDSGYPNTVEMEELSMTLAQTVLKWAAQ